MDKIRLTILGSTGSIGTQALEVIQKNPERFQLMAITAQNNADLLIQQAIQFQPQHVVITSETHYPKVKNALQKYPIQVHTGAEALEVVASLPELTHVLTALVGFAGLKPTSAAIKAGKNIALANKETLVVAGQLISDLAKKHQVRILPVDSEHSAIFQCLTGENFPEIEKIYLTASGGPFRGFSKEQLKKVTKAQALKHPNWSMGQKITIDSSTLMNKGLEVIEAKWLFDLDIDQIDVIVHPQSIIHSIVQFVDGSMKAQMGLPDMKLPIQYALSYPSRWRNQFPRFDFLKYPNLTFEKPDYEAFPCLTLAFEVLKKGGNLPCILNAANEMAVQMFLEEKIFYFQIPQIIERMLVEVAYISNPTLEDFVHSDLETRLRVKKIFESK